MGKGSSAPTPPDPAKTAAAQTGTNVSTALANAQLGNVNQYGPDGSVTYATNGGQTITDPSSGATYFIPQYEQTTTLSEAQQAIKDRTDVAEQNMAQLAQDQSARLNGLLSEPFSLDGIPGAEAFDRQRMEDALNSRMDSRLGADREALNTRLVNQGIAPGSEAYNREMQTFGQNVNDARMQSILGAGTEQANQAAIRGQAVSEQFAARNQPINEITALLSGSQVNMPTFAAGTNQPSIPTTDYAGLVNQNYNQRLNAWQQNNANRNSLLGGLFGAAGKLGAAAITSDRRLKTDVAPVGAANGFTLYSYRYLGGATPQIGLMADEVEKVRPHAVIRDTPDGYARVDYAEALS
tara:strand:- start:44 stop:1099 length:1056 start_codon:yes stop_codon:yes gene_type:complete